ncbi:hypothetical protein [Catenulispora pinisilvae]|uniref:hypothetical protein n=1 Tax=Catenulispora pinisilvae TaxID=2705253 RepID=UPI001891A583|nr:hypothetical protein [Catenulispora pinisilvae]
MPILWLHEGGLDRSQYYKRGFQVFNHHRRGGRASVGVVLGATLLAAAGCASSSSGASKAPSGPTSSAVQAPTSSPSATGPAESASSSAAVDQNSPQSQAAIATYRAMWADVVKVQATMNDRDLTLTDHLTGGALTYFHQAIYLNKQNGYVAKGEPKLLHPTATEITGSGDSAKVLVEDCMDDTSYNLYTADSTLVTGGQPNGRHKTQALVETTGGVLKVSAFALSAAGTC